MHSQRTSFWSTSLDNPVNRTKKWLARLSVVVRERQYQMMLREVGLKQTDKVLDMGISPNEELSDTNFFEKRFPFPENLTAASVEDCRKLQKKYPLVKILTVKENARLPFEDKQFDLAVSWATLEHTGGYDKQEYFLNELLRVGKNVFVTTPYRGCPYEPHTGTFFLHYLPLNMFRKYLLSKGKAFMADESNLNPLWIEDIRRFRLCKGVKVKIYRMFGIFPSHILIYTTGIP